MCVSVCVSFVKAPLRVTNVTSDILPCHSSTLFVKDNSKSPSVTRIRAPLIVSSFLNLACRAIFAMYTHLSSALRTTSQFLFLSLSFTPLSLSLILTLSLYLSFSLSLSLSDTNTCSSCCIIFSSIFFHRLFV